MKQILKYTFLLLITLSSCQTKPKEVIIKGKFKGDIPNEIGYSKPINGTCFGYFRSSAKVDSMGNFEILLNIEEPCFITLFLNDNDGQLLLEQGEVYNVTIETEQGKNTITYNCKNKVIQTEYQKLFNPHNPAQIGYKYKDLPISVVNKKLDSMYLNDISTFEVQLNDGILPSVLYDKIKLDRKLLYNAALQFYTAINFSNALVKGLEVKTDSIDTVWNNIILQNPFDSKLLLSSKWAYSYIQYLLEYHEYTEANFTFEQRKKARGNGNIHTYMLNIAKKFLEPDLLEFYTASYIIRAARQDKFEKELIDLLEEFKVDFPTSNYLAELEAPIQKIIDFHKKIAESEFEKEVTFVENYKNINSLEECFTIFRGKRVYVDLWTTSCGYCKDEFAFKDELRSLDLIILKCFIFQ
ncbi:hypothetical protein [Carboxylicivirga caseinilyticus]|uniref:hypothetical protein n=1 Tax=Carboxylicivirga caseinilyticus TaxID=3417572 RepID=UPI003D330BC6|nr:hypothetical protein [Marinilabiliaceae bacterium A049]